MDIRKGQKESAGEIDVQELIDKTFGRRLIIWGAEADGQLGNRNHEEEEKYAKKTYRPKNNRALHESQHGRKGNGGSTQNIPKTADDADGNMGKPKIARMGKWKQQQEDETKENWEKENWGGIYDNLDQSGRSHKAANRLHRDK